MVSATVDLLFERTYIERYLWLGNPTQACKMAQWRIAILFRTTLPRTTTYANGVMSLLFWLQPALQNLRSDIVNPGESKSDIAMKIDRHFTRLGWRGKRFQTKITVDDQTYDAPTHKVDCYMNRVAQLSARLHHKTGEL
jgi:Restriction endonuclease BglII